MQIHRNSMICLMVLFGSFLVTSIDGSVDSSNEFASTEVNAADEQSSKSNVVMKQQHLRSSASEMNPTATISTSSDRDTAIEEDDRDLQYYTSNDDFYNTFIEENCKGFKYKIDDNGDCQITTAYYALVAGIVIGVIVAIVLCSCACCKCCIWYPYMGYAIDEENSRSKQQGTATARPAYSATPVAKTTNTTKSSTVTAAYPTVAMEMPTCVRTTDPQIDMSMPTGTTTTYDV